MSIPLRRPHTGHHPEVRLPTRRIETPLGPMAASVSDGGLTGLVFADEDVPAGEHALLDAIERWVHDYFRDPTTPMCVPLDLTGTPFERDVWRAVGAVPAGDTATYGSLAMALGRPGGAQAVGRANGKNPVALVVPCHRVIGRDGSLTGYAWGLDIKRALLEHEGALRETLPLFG